MKKHLALLAVSTAFLFSSSALQVSAQETNTETTAPVATPLVEENTSTAPTADTAAAPEEKPAEAAPETAAAPEEKPAEAAPEAAAAPEEKPAEAAAVPEVNLNENSPLLKTSWGLLRITNSKGKTVLKPNNPRNFVLTFKDANNLTAQINCNEAQTSWTEKDAQALSFAPLGITAAECKTKSPIDARMFSDWENVKSYELKKRRLFLHLDNDGGIYELISLKPRI